MTTHLAELCRKKRIEKGLKLGQLARLLGYANVAKACNKVQMFEQRGTIEHGLLVKLAAALQISDDELWEAIEEDLTEKMNHRQEVADELKALRASYPYTRAAYRVLWPDESSE